jgi:hypothetical protein
MQKIMDAIAIVSAGLQGNVLEHGAQSDGAGAELLDVGELVLNTG